MTRHIFWLAALIISFSVGYWMGKDGPPTASRREAPNSEAFLEETKQHQAASAPNPGVRISVQRGTDLQPGSPSLSPGLCPPDDKEPDHRGEQTPRDVRVYNLNDPFKREEYAAYLREEGVPEEEIRSILRISEENDESRHPSP